MDAENVRVVSGEEADGDREVAAAAALNDVGELETIVEEIAIVDGEAAAVAAQDDASLHEITDGSEPMAADGGSEPVASDLEPEDAAETAARRNYEGRRPPLWRSAGPSTSAATATRGRRRARTGRSSARCATPSLLRTTTSRRRRRPVP